MVVSESPRFARAAVLVAAGAPLEARRVAVPELSAGELLASLAEAAWLREIEGLRNKGQRKGVEQRGLSEMLLMSE